MKEHREMEARSNWERIERSCVSCEQGFGGQPAATGKELKALQLDTNRLYILHVLQQLGKN